MLDAETGEVMPMDLLQLAHLLLAGVTGAGKSVCIKLMMVDLVKTKMPNEPFCLTR